MTIDDTSPTSHPIKRLLVANRGEIARRIFRTARQMRITTIAIYSDADRHSQHVQEADEAIYIGPSPALESYLNIDQVLDAAKSLQADAIHPGYGFLSENPLFAQACDDAGIRYVGPNADTIERMGHKDTAKALMAEAGVPVLPGYYGDRQEPEFLYEQSQSIGFPVMIKAVAGGGGKGMRPVHDEKTFFDDLEACRREANAAFGNDRVLIEKLVQRPRHIELQVLGDHYGHAVCLFDRDCSVQRRHQKLIEEAPAPDLEPGIRQAMQDAAIQAVTALGYHNAGTVEFLVDTATSAAQFYFMEMNTRLQVEHTVTESITDTDLVEWQLRVAQGESLQGLRIPDEPQGHSIEVRICAEDVDRDFLPSIGLIEQLNLPTENANIRVDGGIKAKDWVTPYYDSMLLKLISHGQSRDQAIDHLVTALDTLQVEGVKTNRAFLARILGSQPFRSAPITTDFLEKYPISQPQLSDISWLLGILHLALPPVANPLSEGWSSCGDWRANIARQYSEHLGDGQSQRHRIVVRDMGRHQAITGLDQPYQVLARRLCEHQLELMLGSDRHTAHVFSTDQYVEVRLNGDTHVFHRLDVTHNLDEISQSDSQIRAPMPGQVIELAVSPNDTVEEGQTVAILEAMKMEHRLTAPFNAEVAAVHVQTGDQVQNDALLVTLESVSD